VYLFVARSVQVLKVAKDNGEYRPGRMVRASQVAECRQVENGDWKYLVFDKNTDRPRMPQGSVG
jgi:nitrate reductase alpha subunit